MWFRTYWGISTGAVCPKSPEGPAASAFLFCGCWIGGVKLFGFTTKVSIPVSYLEPKFEVFIFLFYLIFKRKWDPCGYKSQILRFSLSYSRHMCKHNCYLFYLQSFTLLCSRHMCKHNFYLLCGLADRWTGSI